ncbi:MAG: capsid cement protein [Dokdonella sp.]
MALSVAATAALLADHFCTALGAVAGAAGVAFGVNRQDAAIGDLVTVDCLGTAIVVAGGAIAKGAYVEVGANGKAVTHAAGKIVGQALEAAAADGDRIELYLIQSSA